jgi:hypothetical protein
MTREEFKERIGLSEKTAKIHLNVLRIQFVFLFIEYVTIRTLVNTLQGSDLFALLFPINLIVIVASIVYWVYVLRITKRSGWNAVFGILLSPISWFWFYPFITEPLHVIIGTGKVPDHWPPKSNTSFKKQHLKSLLKAVGICTLIALGLVAIMLLFIEVSS